MLKRMVAEELDKKDTKVFSIPPDLSPQAAFEIGKAAIQRHDLNRELELHELRRPGPPVQYFQVVLASTSKARLRRRHPLPEFGLSLIRAREPEGLPNQGVEESQGLRQAETGG